MSDLSSRPPLVHSESPPSQSPPPQMAPVQRAALVVGVIFLLVGVAGFVPGLTEDVGDIEFAGHQSDAELLGLFQVSILHNLVHVGFGIAGLIAARRARSATLYFLVGGAIYLVLVVYGLIINHDHDANFVPLDSADNWLHLGLGAGMIAIGLLLGDRDRREPHGADGLTSR